MSILQLVKTGFVLLLVFFLSSASLLQAEVPGQINFQGRLNDDTGTPISGTFSMSFNLYTMPDGPDDLLWHEDQSVVEVINGIYNVQLGAFNPLDANDFPGDEVYLDIRIRHDGITEILWPRQRITTTAFAFRASFADTLQGKTVSQILDNADGDGLRVTADRYGVYVVSAGVDGLHVESSGDDGVQVVSADDDGFYVNSAGDNGVYVGSAGNNGVYVFKAGSPTTTNYSSENNGFEVAGAEGYGLFVGRADLSGVRVDSAEYNGLYVESAGFAGVQVASADQYGIRVLSAGAYAGYFNGDVHVTGALTKGSGTFKIDHPLDPENKYLSHSFVESPDMKNIYDGVVTFDDNGEAWVELPEWFEALNRDFRYQLTCIGGGAQVYIAEKISNNTFKIAGGYAGLEVSWQVTGIRQDPFAQANPISVEEDKPQEELGTYLHPDAYGMPETMGVTYKETQAILHRQKDKKGGGA